MHTLVRCQQTHQEAQRLLARCPWLPWALPIAFGAIVFPLRFAADRLAGAVELLPADQPYGLLLWCLGAAVLCVPLYQAEHVDRLSLLGVLLYLALFVLHVLNAVAQCPGPRLLGAAFGMVDVLLLAYIVVGGAGWPPVGSADLRQRVWVLTGSTTPLLLVPQILTMIALTV